jgi:Plasmid recombination enzyme
MSAAAVLRVKKLKGNSGIIKVAARHNRRDIQAELGADSHIDPARTCLNETLQGAATPDGVAQLAKDLMRGAGIGKLRKDAVLGIEAVFSLPPDTAINDTAYFTDCATWAGVYFGGAQNILSVDIHRDEAAPHCHVLILPLVDNRMDGSNLIGGKQKMLAMQKLFYEAVASRYGLRKAPARLSGETKQAAAKAVLQKLRETADTALNSSLWATFREMIERDPAPYLMALGLVIDKPKKAPKTMTAIFTGKGKGSNIEIDNRSNPIGFAVPAKRQTLCSVGFDQKQSPQGNTKVAPRVSASKQESGMVETVRVRESENDPAYFNPETGEFFKPPQTTRSNRAAADSWVAGALSQHN